MLTAIGTHCATAQPAITSLSATSGGYGTPLTITGTGFASSPWGNEVSIGAVKAAVFSGDATHITVLVPNGATHGPVMVRNMGNGLSAASSAAFLPTYDNSLHVPGTINFKQFFDLPTGMDAEQTLIHDMDNDGKADILVLDNNRTTLSIFWNEHTGGPLTATSFTSPTVINMRTHVTGLNFIVRDMNGDGRPDIVIRSASFWNWQYVDIVSNDGGRSFAAPVAVYSRRSSLTDIAIDDIDGNGKPDIIASFSSVLLIDTVLSMSYKGLTVLPNISTAGTLTFATAFDITTSAESPSGVTTGDLDMDGKIDLVLTDGYSGSEKALVFRNVSSIGTLDVSSFAPPVTFPIGEGASTPVIVDWNGDGKPEIAANFTSPAKVAFLPNTSTPGSITGSSFGAPVIKYMSTYPGRLSTGDLDGDGKPDFASAEGLPYDVTVVRNQSVPGVFDWTSFSYPMQFAVMTSLDTGSAASAAIGDLDFDGKPDLVVSTGYNNTLAILVNNPLLPIGGNLNVCLGGTSALSNPIAGGTWSSSNPTFASVNSSTGMVTGHIVGTATITYTRPVSEGGYVTATVSVQPYPSAITGASYLCPSTSVTLANATGGGTWSSGNTSIVTIGSSTGIATGVAAGTATVSYTSAVGCTVTKTLNVMTAPGSISGATIRCSGSHTYSNPVAGGTWSSSNTSCISFPSSSSGFSTALNAGTATVTYTTCGITTTTVTVTPAKAGVFASKSTVCAGSSSTLQVVTNNTWFNTVTSIPYAPYAAAGATLIASDDGSLLVPMPFPVKLFGTTYYNMYVNVNGFVSFGSATSSMNYTARALPSSNAPVNSAPQAMIALFWHDMNSTTTGTITKATIGSAPNRIFVISYNGVADYSGSATNTGQIIIYENSGIIDMMIGNTGGGTAYNKTCGIQNATGTNGVAAPGQNGVPYTVSNIGWRFSGTLPGSATYSWSPASTLNNSTIANPVATPTVAGSATYSVAVSTPGCNVTGNTTLSVNPTPAPIGGPASVCAGSNVTLTNTTAGGWWASSNNTKATVGLTSGIVSGVAAGTATISYWIVGTGCMATRVQTVVVPADPGVISAVTTTVPVGGTILVTNYATGGVWSSTDATKATVNAAGVVTGIAPGNPTIRYSVTNACGTATALKPISVVSPRPGIDENGSTIAAFRIYPNPASGNISLETTIAGTFFLFTIDGKQLQKLEMNPGTNNISLPYGLAAGVYMCRFDGADGSTEATRLIYRP